MKIDPLHRLKRAYWRWHAQHRVAPTKPPPPPASARVPPALRFACDLVIDVGANTGQYAAKLRASGYGGRIISLEPLPDAHAQLAARAAADPLWEVYPRCALGATAGTGTLNVAGNSVSSSLLPMLDLHAEAAPESVYTGQVETPIITLDSLLEHGLDAARRPYLKIDTQGFEADVLAGGVEILPRMHAVEIELSLAPLYAGQQSWRWFIDFFEARGFHIWELRSAFRDPRDGRMLQMDALFRRSEA